MYEKQLIDNSFNILKLVTWKVKQELPLIVYLDLYKNKSYKVRDVHINLQYQDEIFAEYMKRLMFGLLLIFRGNTIDYT